MAGKITDMTSGGAGVGTDRFEITRDPTGAPLTRYQDLDGVLDYADTQAAYAVMSVQAGVAAEATVDATPRKIAAWNTDGAELNMTVDSTTGNDITADVAGVFDVHMSLSFTGSASKTFQLEVYVNGVASGFAVDRKMGASGDVGASGIHGILSLAATDTVEVYQSSSDGGSALTATEGQLIVSRMAA